MTWTSWRPVRLAYQPPANSTFLSEKPVTGNQPTLLFSQNKPAPAISHQPTEQAALDEPVFDDTEIRSSTVDTGK
jgi:hypothetical protein